MLHELTRPYKRLLQVSLHPWHRFHTKRKLPLFSCKEVTVNYYLSLFLQSAPLSAPLWTRRTGAGLLGAFSPNIYANHLAWFFRRVEAKSLAHPDKGIKIGFSFRFIQSAPNEFHSSYHGLFVSHALWKWPKNLAAGVRGEEKNGCLYSALRRVHSSHREAGLGFKCGGKMTDW